MMKPLITMAYLRETDYDDWEVSTTFVAGEVTHEDLERFINQASFNLEKLKVILSYKKKDAESNRYNHAG